MNIATTDAKVIVSAQVPIAMRTELERLAGPRRRRLAGRARAAGEDVERDLRSTRTARTAARGTVRAEAADCLLEEHPEVGRGLDIACRFGVADLDENGTWVVGDRSRVDAN